VSTAFPLRKRETAPTPIAVPRARPLAFRERSDARAAFVCIEIGFAMDDLTVCCRLHCKAGMKRAWEAESTAGGALSVADGKPGLEPAASPTVRGVASSGLRVTSSVDLNDARPLTDPKSYRLVTLSNGLRALLVSDPRTSSSGAGKRVLEGKC
jgi:hypothetical protein